MGQPHSTRAGEEATGWTRRRYASDVIRLASRLRQVRSRPWIHEPKLQQNPRAGLLNHKRVEAYLETPEGLKVPSDATETEVGCGINDGYASGSGHW